MRETVEGHRAELLVGLRRFVAAACHVPGVRRIAPVGSIVTAKPDPKDVDVLIVVSDDADLAPLAAQGGDYTATHGPEPWCRCVSRE